MDIAQHIWKSFIQRSELRVTSSLQPQDFLSLQYQLIVGSVWSSRYYDFNHVQCITMVRIDRCASKNENKVWKESNCAKLQCAMRKNIFQVAMTWVFALCYMRMSLCTVPAFLKWPLSLRQWIAYFSELVVCGKDEFWNICG